MTEPNREVANGQSSSGDANRATDEVDDQTTSPNELSRAEFHDAAWLRAFRRKLITWYEANQRDMPWRMSRDPYRVWLSEVMLQQTQVNTVRPYFERFVAAFPTVAGLAAADEQQVLRLWEGLGYYRRARQLHAAAKQIVEQHAGQFPRDVDSVRQLPGIGRYTAGAIMSIAFDQRAPILEANTVRLFSRLLAFAGDTASTDGQRLLWRFAESLLPRKGAGSGTINQALMELGSQICTPRAPACTICPAAKLCPTNQQGLQASIPLVRKKPAATQVREAAVVIHRGDRVLLGLRGETARWAGLWDFPRFELTTDGEVSEQPENAAHAEIAAQVEQLCGLKVTPRGRFATIRHGVTRFQITLECHHAEFVADATAPSQPLFIEQRWVAPAELADYPLSTTGRKIAKLILQSQQQRLF